jgi:hypothetical protein
MKKECSMCHRTFPLNQFGIQKASKWVKTERPKSYCRKCESIGVEKSRQKLKLTDPKTYRKNQTNKIKINKRIKLRNLAFILRYLKMFGKCVDCGLTDDRVLEFDHIKGKKVKGVIRLAGTLTAITKIKDEIRKCELRCCNCHRIKTQEQFGWRGEWTTTWIK